MKKQKKITYGIIGLGRFGTGLAYKLASMGAEILVIDRDEDKIAELRDVTENAYICKNLEKKTLSDIGIQNCDVVIVCIATSIDVSILTVMKLQSLGISRIIAKATSAEHGEILKKLGAEIVFPEQDMALRLANRLEMGLGLDFIELNDSINITKIEVPVQFIGLSIKDVNLRNNYNLNIIAIENDKKVIDTIHPEYIFREKDILYLSGNKTAIVKFNNWLASAK